MRHPDFNIAELIQAVQGSSDSLDDIVEKKYPGTDWMSDMTKEELAYFDSRVFQCAQCGWWFDQRERDKSNEREWTCKECK